MSFIPERCLVAKRVLNGYGIGDGCGCSMPAPLSPAGKIQWTARHEDRKTDIIIATCTMFDRDDQLIESPEPHQC